RRGRITGCLANGAQVDTGHEGPVTHRGEDRGPHLAVVVERTERVADLVEGRPVDRVHRRPVEGHGRDVVLELNGDAHRLIMAANAGLVDDLVDDSMLRGRQRAATPMGGVSMYGSGCFSTRPRDTQFRRSAHTRSGGSTI